MSLDSLLHIETHICVVMASLAPSIKSLSTSIIHTSIKTTPKKSHKYRKLSNICLTIYVLSVEKLTAFLVSHSYIGVELNCFTGQGSILGLIADVAHL